MKIHTSKWMGVAGVAAVAATAGGFGLAHAATTSGNLMTAITPCRLVDTRAESSVGTRSTPIGAGETIEFLAIGDNGECTGIAAGARAIEVQLTSTGATSDTFLTAFPSNLASPPNVSHLNPLVGTAVASNTTTVTLSPDGTFSVYNKAGSTHLIVDVLGVYAPETFGDGIGVQGQIGPVGPAGAVGAVGAQGLPGLKGDKGDQGDTGAQGPAGADGAQGPAGADGAAGPAGPEGPEGPAGADGAAGPAGADGATGPAGADGATGPAGPVGPAGADGAVGPAGPDGAVGPAGPAGPAGADGAVGPAGAEGPAGPVGPAGADGEVGPAGPAGPAGPTGAAGIAGVEIVQGTPSGSTDNAKTVTATCPAGKVALGGGYTMSNDNSVVTASYPSAANVWTVSGSDGDTPGNSSDTYTLRAFVICGTLPA